MKKYLLIILCFGIWNCEEGADGLSGENGQDGVDGENGLSTILYTLDEPSGDNCANGGVKIVYGIDINDDAVLSDSEIDNSTYICNGNNGTDAEVEEQHPIVGIWYRGDTTLSITQTVIPTDDGNEPYYVQTIIDTTVYEYGTRERLIFTDEGQYYHHQNITLWNAIDEFTSQIDYGNYSVFENILWFGQGQHNIEFNSDNTRLRYYRQHPYSTDPNVYFYERQ